MGTIITGTLTIEPAWNKQKNKCTKNMRTITEIQNLWNNKKIVKE